MRVFTISFVVALVACGRFTVDDGRADVVGQVIDAQGGPVAGVRVMLIRDRRPIAETTSASDGRFRLKGTPGAAAVFGLQSSVSDQGVWRPDLELLPTGETDVGQLELETVWAHPEVLWLRGAGFDEQLTRPEDGLEYLWGGAPGEMLLATRTRKSGYELVRVDDDGTPTILASGPGLECCVLSANGVQPRAQDAGTPVFYLPGTDVHGATVILKQTGGYSFVHAGGAESIPVKQLTWLDALTGEAVLDVPVPDDSATSVVPGRGAILGGSAGTVFASLERRATFSLPPDTFGQLQATKRGLFIARESSTEVWLSRLTADGQVTSGRRVARPSGLTNGTEVVDDQLVRVSLKGPFSDGTLGSMTVIRFDAETLEPRIETITVGGEDPELGPFLRNQWVWPCQPSTQRVLEEVFDRGVRHTRIGAIASDRRQWRIDGRPLPGLSRWRWTDEDGVAHATNPLLNASQGCPTPDGFWRVLRPDQAGLQLLRVKQDEVELVDLPANVLGLSNLGPWPMMTSIVDGRSVVTLLRPDASLDDPRALARVPFVLTMGTPSPDGRSVFTLGVGSDGRRSIFRVPAPFGASR